MDFDDNRNDVCKQDEDADRNEDQSLDVQDDTSATDSSHPTETKVEKKKMSKKTKNLIISIAIIISVIGILLFLFKDVIRTTFKIGMLGDIYISSYSYNKLTEANSNYEQLNKFEQSVVINRKQLEIANQEFSDDLCELFNKRIDEYTKNVTVEYYDKLTNLQYYYKNLSDQEKSKIKNAEALNSAVKKVEKLKAVEVVKEIKNLANGDSSSAEYEIIRNKNLLSKEQIEECLAEIGRWEAVDEADELIISCLKSPKSYNRYEAYTSKPYQEDNGNYSVNIEIKYGATNSFNAEVTDIVNINVEYTVDIEYISVSFVDTDFSTYDKYRIMTGY